MHKNLSKVYTTYKIVSLIILLVLYINCDIFIVYIIINAYIYTVEPF